MLGKKGKGFNVRPADSRLKLNELSKKDASARSSENSSLSTGELRNPRTSSRNSEGGSQRCIEFGWRMFAVKAAGKGFTSIKAVNGRNSLQVDVAICERKSFTAAFRFLRHEDGDGRMRPATTWKPEDAPNLLRMASDIFAPQVNIYFNKIPTGAPSNPCTSPSATPLASTISSSTRARPQETDGTRSP